MFSMIMDSSIPPRYSCHKSSVMTGISTGVSGNCCRVDRYVGIMHGIQCFDCNIVDRSEDHTTASFMEP